VRSLAHVWPCSAPLQPFTVTAFPSPSLSLKHFCAHLTFHHSLSCPISHFPPRFPHDFLTALCPLWHICCLETGFECLPRLCLPLWRYCWNHLILYFPKSRKHLNLTFQTFCCMSLVLHPKIHQKTRTDNRINSVPKLYSLDLGTFRAALLFCSPQRFWHHVILILS
jgi:hypothetical protein